MLLFNSTALLSQWKPRDTYQNLQRHRAVLPTIARLLVQNNLLIFILPMFVHSRVLHNSITVCRKIAAELTMTPRDDTICTVSRRTAVYHSDQANLLNR